jgi:cobalt-zinc-cadmium efflux system protein
MTTNDSQLNNKLSAKSNHSCDHHDHNHEQGHSHDHDHDHDHSHGHHHHHHGSDGTRKGLTIALIITATIMLVEFIGGWITGSLALLSDSGHMLSDTASLLLSLLAVGFAAKPPSPDKTYGYYRFEILAALVNGITLVGVSGFIIWEAIGRLQAPPEVNSGGMILIALIGLFANIVSAWSLIRKGNVKDNINLRSAYLHVIGDALGSLGAIAAGVIMYAFGWYIADPIISVLVAVLILKGAWGVLSHSVHILMEGTPHRIDQSKVQEALLSIKGVDNVHDLHIWSLTSGMDAFSCHLLIGEGADSQQVLQAAIEVLANRFNITHTTIQVETRHIQHKDLH